MTDQKFEVKGQFKISDKWKPYTKVIEAPTEKLASEWVYTILGSKHRLKRNYIKINSIRLTDGE